MDRSAHHGIYLWRSPGPRAQVLGAARRSARTRSSRTGASSTTRSRRAAPRWALPFGFAVVMRHSGEALTTEACRAEAAGEAADPAIGLLRAAAAVRARTSVQTCPAAAAAVGHRHGPRGQAASLTPMYRVELAAEAPSRVVGGGAGGEGGGIVRAEVRPQRARSRPPAPPPVVAGNAARHARLRATRPLPAHGADERAAARSGCSSSWGRRARRTRSLRWRAGRG
jgi:hypothetical protein